MDWLLAKRPIKVHHSVDCHNRKGEFEGWTREERDAYVRRILPIIRDHHIEGHFAAVDKREITRLVASHTTGAETALRKYIGDNFYLVCLNWAMRSAWDILTARGHKEIAFFCETNAYLAGMAQVFADLSKKHPERQAQFAAGGKTKYVPLQCADMIAFEGNRQMQFADFHAQRRKPLVAIDPVGHRFGYLKYSTSDVGPLADHTFDFIKRMHGG